jgi:hypothetical protein
MLNDKATVFLVELETEILTNENVEKKDLTKPLAVAADYTNQAISTYENWMKDMGSLSEEEIKERISPYFKANDPAFGDMNADRLLKKRIRQILDAQVETPRRLSVSLTNLGMINRYLGNLQEAKVNYESAIELWDRNYTAKDNLAILLNQPVKKRSMLSRLFPPEKIDKSNKKD